ncbi:helix-turn-helix domain-containing protein [Paenibacillus alkaliterrae]|uniref:helix-turn-helix domain-containing protein n=1 Tax=Paenibacillus alkaliterrae TaxID=320909 RepID=UPI001F32BD52|nr:helix-turn-helix domain-containing protein [Paenibacillus alkaliterrae]MCF2937987.1 helix-turn-helix domain-containing protein [Paenibacillus alkaliterrae]
MMSKSWFNRLLLSYMPIFIIVVTFTFFVFFQLISEQGRKEAINANSMLSLQAMRLIDTSLKAIDNMVMKESINSKPLIDFFNGKEGGDPYVNISAVMKMKDMIAYYPLIDSIYLVRYDDQMVLSNATNGHIGTYPDKSFIEQYRKSASQKWTDVRTFRQFTVLKGKKVVSLVRGAPFMTNEKGMIVVNVAADSLQRLVNELYDSEVSFIRIKDGAGNELLKQAETVESMRIYADYKSSYSNWSYISGFVQGTFIQTVSLLYNAWFVIGLLMIGAGLVWMIYISRRNARPVEQIVSRFSGYMLPLAGGRTNAGRIDEFVFIESALDNLTEQAKQYQQQYKEDLHLRTRNLFHQLIEEGSALTLEDWRREAERLQLPVPAAGHSIIVLEMDKYGEFCSRYSRNDQNLLKFALRSITYEQSSRFGYECWAEWTASSRLSVILFENGDEVDDKRLIQLCDSIRGWTEQNMKFTISVGIGDPAVHLFEIAKSFNQAIEALNYKMVLGENRLITREDMMSQSQVEVYSYLGIIRSAAQSFRKSDDSWRALLDDMFSQLKQGLLTKDEIMNIINYLIYSLGRELSGLGKEYQIMWETGSLPKLTDKLDKCHSLEEMHEAITGEMTELGETLSDTRYNGQHAGIIMEIRRFIEAEYVNPNMSLEYLSEKFNINAKYVSKLFKETTGQKFIDFLIDIRLYEAKRLLAETRRPIQDIAEEVGYTSAISFTRVFKKVVGTSPGEYRLETQREFKG